jgi:hypothetical protein
MRDILDKLDTLLLEKARGLLYRDKGDVFFQGSKENPTAEIVFDKVDYYPGMPGAYANYEEMADAGKDLFQQYSQISWFNKPTMASKAFAILSFDGPAAGQKTYFGKFFNEIKPDMTGFWKNNELPGGWQLDKAASLKGSYYRLKPADLYPPNSTFDSPSAILASLDANPTRNAAVPKIVPGMTQLVDQQVFPTFENAGEMASAIRDDLGETIGPIALIQGMITSGGAEATRKDILGNNGSFAGSAINFPASKINGLVDSYLLHPSGIQIGISSKGEKGATASAKNIADGVTTAREKGMDKLLDQYAEQVQVIERVAKLPSRDLPLVLGQEQGLITKQQAAEILKLIDQGAKDINQVTMSPGDRQVLQDLMDQYNPKKDNVKYNVGYHILAVLAKKVTESINSDPVFGEACLKFLNTSPIIQLHMNTSGKQDLKVTGFQSKYPPDFKGTVGLDASKVYAATGTNGRVTFSYNGGGNTDTDVVDPAEVPTPGEIDTNLDKISTKRSAVTARSGGAEKKSQADTQILGRKRRKK